MAARIALGQRKHVRELAEQSVRGRIVTAHTLSELFIHLSLFLGYPAMLDGLELVATLSKGHKKIPLRNSLERDEATGRRILGKIYGAPTQKLLKSLEQLHPGLGRRITREAYGNIMKRRGLTLAEREVINVVVLFLHRFDKQMYSHLRGSLRVGVRPGDLRAIICHTASLGSRSPRTALRFLELLAMPEERIRF